MHYDLSMQINIRENFPFLAIFNKTFKLNRFNERCSYSLTISFGSLFHDTAHDIKSFS